MYWLDFAIIYFALGAPFGVLRITTKRQITPFSFFRMASGYVLWPLVAIRNVARFLAEARTSVRASTLNASTSHNASERQVHQDVDSLRIELEKALFANRDVSLDSAATRRDLYAFREVFYRYTGLAEAVNGFNSPFTIHHSPLSNSPFTVHHSPLIRAACIARRDRQKLEAQLTQARSELIATLGPRSGELESDQLPEKLEQLYPEENKKR